MEVQLKEVEAIHSKLEADRSKLRHLISEGRHDDAFVLANQILELKPDDAKTAGQLGTLYAIKGKKELAHKYWKSVTDFDPDDPYGESMIGWQAYLDGQYDDALKAYLIAESIEPYFDKINFHMALALAKSGRWTDAIARFQRVLEINPNHLDANLWLNSAFRHEGKPADALPYAIAAVKLTHEQNLGALNVLAETYADNNRFSDAANTAQIMVKLAETQNPKMLMEIRSRLIDWKSRSTAEKR